LTNKAIQATQSNNAIQLQCKHSSFSFDRGWEDSFPTKFDYAVIFLQSWPYRRISSQSLLIRFQVKQKLAYMTLGAIWNSG